MYLIFAGVIITLVLTKKPNYFMKQYFYEVHIEVITFLLTRMMSGWIKKNLFNSNAKLSFRKNVLLLF